MEAEGTDEEKYGRRSRTQARAKLCSERVGDVRRLGDLSLNWLKLVMKQLRVYAVQTAFLKIGRRKAICFSSKEFPS